MASLNGRFRIGDKPLLLAGSYSTKSGFELVGTLPNGLTLRDVVLVFGEDLNKSPMSFVGGVGITSGSRFTFKLGREWSLEGAAILTEQVKFVGYSLPIEDVGFYGKFNSSGDAEVSLKGKVLGLTIEYVLLGGPIKIEGITKKNYFYKYNSN